MPSILLRRVAAYGLDIGILFAVLAPLGFLVQSALGLRPETAQGVYLALVLTFSVPVWTYFTLADRSARGATLGKRWLGLRTETATGGRVGVGQALGRTAVKMVPWELTHAASFLFAPALGDLGVGNWIGIGASYVLVAAYAVVAWRTGGRRSVHDLVASTQVRRVLRPASVSR